MALKGLTKVTLNFKNNKLELVLWTHPQIGPYLEAGHSVSKSWTPIQQIATTCVIKEDKLGGYD